jgi:DNA-3-methyladenine glycosylase II
MPPSTPTKALYHLKKDKKLAGVIKKNPKPDLGRGGDSFQALVRAIVYQQLSGKAAGTIHRRFVALYPRGKHPKPEAVLKTRFAKLRSAGLSKQKASYLKDLSKKFLDGTIEPKKFAKMSDEEIREHVIAVKGIGRWTVDMFLMFTLGRLDVLPTGDLGIQNGFQKLFKMKKRPSVSMMEKLASPWAPYRTIASWYLWRVADAD